MFKNLQKTVMAMAVFLGFASPEAMPINAEKLELDLTAEQISKLKAQFGDDFTVEMLNTVNSEIKAFTNNNMDLKAIQDEIAALVKEKDLLAGEKDPTTGNEPVAEDVSANLALLKANQSKLDAKNKQLEAELHKLMNEGMGDRPDAVIPINRANRMEHSATHLFASNKEYDKFEKRAWNARLRDQSVKATDFNADGTVPLLQDDVAHFVRENPNALTSLFNDFADLPKEWDMRSGVLDRIADGFIIPAEIVQGRSKGWKPKNNFKIAAEEGKVFRKKIDITFDGYELQQIENTWIRSYNGNDGSHPWKKSFVGFLLSELVKRQKLDDRRAQINGIYVETPEGDGNAGAAVNSQDGLRFLFWYHREVTKKYRAFDLGVPTATNIVDYVRNMIMLLPEEDRNKQGMEFGLSQAWLDAYRVRAGVTYQLHMSTDEGKSRYEKNHPIDYPNIIFQPLTDMVKTDFMYITESKNIQILDYNASEKGKFTVTQDRRDTHIFADYRLGIRLKQVGVKLGANEPAEFERQAVWSNSVPVFDSSTSVPVFDDGTGLIKLHYNNMTVDKAFVTDITGIEGATKGQIVKITGNTQLSGVVNVKDGGDLDLTADFNLKLGGTLTLRVLDSGTFKELKRTTSPETAATTSESFDGTAIDANLGTVFMYTGATNKTLADILNGVEGKDVKIYGTDAADVTFTVSDIAGKVEVASNAVLGSSTDYIQLTKVDGVWFETKRVIA